MIENLLKFMCAKNNLNIWSSDEAIAKIKRCSFLPRMVVCFKIWCIILITQIRRVVRILHWGGTEAALFFSKKLTFLVVALKSWSLLNSVTLLNKAGPTSHKASFSLKSPLDQQLGGMVPCPPRLHRWRE